ncbi:MAG: tetratricopeptide repeat protein [Planctomycetes bacterium]|nr:tetratricopeptide repeat protein [Planctomycetota bacterium]
MFYLTCYLVSLKHFLSLKQGNMKITRPILFSLFCFCSVLGCGKDSQYTNVGMLYNPNDYASENTHISINKAKPTQQQINEKLKNMSKDDIFQFALACGDQGNYSEALTAYNKILETDAHYPRIYYYLGLLYRDMGLLDEAICAFQTDLTKNHDSPEAHYNLAYAYQRKGLYNDAIGEYKQSLNFIPANKTQQKANIHYNLGDSYFSIGSIDESIDEYKKALAIKPENKILHKKLGIAYSAKGWTEKAKDEFSIHDGSEISTKKSVN